MTRYFMIVLCLLLAVGSYALRGELHSRQIAGVVIDPEHSIDPSMLSARAELPPPGGVIEVDLGTLHELLPQLAADVRSEQLADWAVYATLLSSGLPTAAIRDATYDKVPFRSAEFEEVASLEYGPGRRLVLDDESVWLFFREGDLQRRVTLGRLADQVRMELGHLPRRVLVFRVQAAEDSPHMRIAREPDLSPAQLFSAEYGYVERVVTNRAEMQDLLDRIDDLTHAKLLDGQRVELGGRRFDEARTLSVTLNDIAALYQAHMELGLTREPGFSLDPQWDVKQLVSELHLLLDKEDGVRQLVERSYSALQLRAKNDKSITPASMPIEIRNLNELLYFMSQQSALQVPEGFRARLSKILAALEPERQRSVADGDPFYPFIMQQQLLQLQKRRLSGNSQDDANLVPFFELQDELRRDSSLDGNVTLGLLNLLAARHRSQCARYDGPLQGTRVGMNLFYTDLMAKIWQGVDYYRSAPTDAIPGFLSLPSVSAQLEPLYWEEVRRLNATRLWFGPKKEGYSVGSDGEALHFAHVATRVYAAGSNPLRPGREESPNEASRRSLGWWDRHYAQVADYEPEYHLQNQIMKWSLLTGRFADRTREQGMASHFSYLSEEKVDHSQRFDRFMQENQALRFRQDVRFRDPSLWLNKTECIEILRSYDYEGSGGSGYIKGGVSLGSGRSLNVGSRISPSVSGGLRRAGMNYDKSSSLGNRWLSWMPRALRPANRLDALRGTRFELPSLMQRGIALSKLMPGRQARLRSAGLELSSQRLQVQTRVENGAGEITIGTSRHPLFGMHFQRSGNGLRLDRVAPQSAGAGGPRPLSEVFAKVPMLIQKYGASKTQAQDGSPLLIEDNGRVIRIEKVAGGTGLVQVLPVDSPKSISHQALAKTAVLDVQDQQSIPKYFEATEISPTQLASKLNEMPWQRLQVLDGKTTGLGPAVERVFSKSGPGPNAQPLTLQVKDPALGQLEARIEGNSLFVRRPNSSSPAAQQSFNELVSREQITPRFLERTMQGGFPTQQKVVISPQLGRNFSERAASSLERNDLRGTMRELGQYLRENPKRLRAEIEDLSKQYLAMRQQILRPLSNSKVAADRSLPGQVTPDPSLGKSATTPDRAGSATLGQAAFAQKASDFRPGTANAPSPKTPQVPSNSQSGSVQPNLGQLGQPRSANTQPQWVALLPLPECADTNANGRLDDAELLPCCDRNHNGTLEARELAACCDLDHDGTASPAELLRCRNAKPPAARQDQSRSGPP